MIQLHVFVFLSSQKKTAIYCYSAPAGIESYHIMLCHIMLCHIII